MSLKIITVVDSEKDRTKILEKFPFLEQTFFTKESVQKEIPNLHELCSFELYEDEFSIIEIAQYCFDAKIDGHIFYIAFNYNTDLDEYYWLDWEIIEKYSFKNLIENRIYFDLIINYLKSNEYLSNLLAIDSDEFEKNENGFSEFSVKAYVDRITVGYYNNSILITICVSESFEKNNIRKILNVSYETWLEQNEYEKLENKVKELILLRENGNLWKNDIT